MTNRSPTSRSLEYLRKQGYLACVVEKWVPRANVRKDAFDCIDILAVNDDEVLGVQVTTRANFAARVTKIQALDHYEQLKACPMVVAVHGWSKMASGKYELRSEIIA